MEKRVEKLEKGSAPGTRLADLCLKLMDAQNIAYRSSDSETRQQIDSQLERLGCYEDVPAYMQIGENEVDANAN